jgi:RNA polymerase sigma factor (sigma-70 family)
VIQKNRAPDTGFDLAAPPTKRMTPRMMPRGNHEVALSRDQIESMIAEHSGGLLRLARQNSLCTDDAHDAYQRAIEIFLRRAASLEPQTAASWLRTVVKNEARAVRRSRLQLVGRDEVDPDQEEASNLPTPDECLLSADLTARSAEALQRLKPQEIRALWLRAQGHSYTEIGEICGWSYTKVNRCISEGRRAFLERFAGIESGAECERWAPVLSAMADGEATAAQLAEARPHLRNCPGCRATLRDFHDVPREVNALVPAATIGLLGAVRAVFHGIRDAAVTLMSRSAVSAEVAGASAVGSGGTLAAGGMKVAALCASLGIAAGGTYCLGQSGLVPHAGKSSASSFQRSAAAPALAEQAREDDRIDRNARRAAATELASVADARQRREGQSTVRRRTRPPTRPSFVPTPSTTNSRDFTFESDDSGGDASPAPAPPQTQSEPSTSATPSDEFGGGGFEGAGPNEP